MTQTITVPNDSKYLVAQAFTPAGGSESSDIVVAQEVLDTRPSGVKMNGVDAPGVPEPATWALMLAGVAGVGGFGSPSA